MLIELKNVRKHYGSIRALDGVSAAIEGKVIGLLGPNGAGKSTLLKCMLGLIPHQGEAVVLGHSSKAESFRIRDRVGYMPESDSYLEGMTAVEVCAYAGQLSGLPPREAMQRAHAALYYADLEDKRYLKVDGYSTGLKQRVKLAQALVHDPDLLFLDEPTNGLDPRSRDDMLRLIAELPVKRGCSIIVSTHLLPDVDAICDHAVIMNRGQLGFAGTIDELRLQTVAAADRSFEVEVKRDADLLGKHLRSNGCNVGLRGELVLAIEVPEGESSTMIFAAAVEKDVQIRRLKPERETLEEAFLRVVGASTEVAR